MAVFLEVQVTEGTIQEPLASVTDPLDPVTAKPLQLVLQTVPAGQLKDTREFARLAGVAVANAAGKEESARIARERRIRRSVFSMERWSALETAYSVLVQAPVTRDYASTNVGRLALDAACREIRIGPGGVEKISRKKRFVFFNLVSASDWGRAETVRFLNEDRADRLRGVLRDQDTPGGVEK